MFGSVVLAFGLVHGLGLSTRLQDLGLPEDGLVPRVLLFNLGVEVGQLAALTLIVGLGTLIVRRLAEPEEWARVAFIALAAAGVIGAGVLASSGSGDDEVTADGCRTEETDVPPVEPGAGHPAKEFYGPTEPAPEADLDHVVGDGYFIVRYRPGLPEADIEAVRGLITTQGVVVAPDPELTDDVRAIQAEETLTCSTLDIGVIADFRDEWLARFEQ